MNDPLVLHRFYHLNSGMAWYATQYDEIDNLYYGLYIEGQEAIWIYFSLDEIESMNNVFVDLDFKPCNLSRVIEQYHPVEKII